MMAFVAPNAFAEQPEKVTVVYTVQPPMHCQNCENKIKTNIRFEKGVNEITTDIKTNTVKVVYDTRKTDSDKIVKAFSKIGYTATEVKPE